MKALIMSRVILSYYYDFEDHLFPICLVESDDMNNNISKAIMTGIDKYVNANKPNSHSDIHAVDITAVTINDDGSCNDDEVFLALVRFDGSNDEGSTNILDEIALSTNLGNKEKIEKQILHSLSLGGIIE